MKTLDISKAICADIDGAVFFPQGTPGRKPVNDNGSHITKDQAERQVADTYCIGMKCPIIEECREEAIKHHDYGVRGGTTENERADIRQARIRAQKEMKATA